jgi:hypothetical protein
MAASGLSFYNLAKKYLMDGTIDLDVDGDFFVHLATSASNASTFTLSTLASLTNRLSSARGYTLSGHIVTAQTWSAGASAKEYRFDGSVLPWSASGGNLGSASAGTNTKFGVLVAVTGASAKDGANKLVGWWKLSTSGFDVTDGNTLTLTPSANGLFELN